MIDVENQIVSAVMDALDGSAEVQSDLTRKPGRFPCVYVVEADNYVYTRTITGTSNENHANVMYEIHCYTNDETGKKSKCKEVFAKVDDKMLRLGFTRMSRTNVTQENATIYRIVGRYTAVISKNNIIYRG